MLIHMLIILIYMYLYRVAQKDFFVKSFVHHAAKKDAIGLPVGQFSPLSSFLALLTFSLIYGIIMTLLHESEAELWFLLHCSAASLLARNERGLIRQKS